MAARRYATRKRKGAPGAVCRASGPRATGPLAAFEQASVRQSGEPWPLRRALTVSQPATTARATACSRTRTQTVASSFLLELGGVLIRHRDRPTRSYPPLLDVQVISVLLARGLQSAVAASLFYRPNVLVPNHPLNTVKNVKLGEVTG